jgi:AcrR family transcriptional regulator
MASAGRGTAGRSRTTILPRPLRGIAEIHPFDRGVVTGLQGQNDASAARRFFGHASRKRFRRRKSPILFERPKRVAILRVALELFANGGYQRTSIAEIAQSAGVTLDTFYKYFGSKQQLARVIYLDVERERDCYLEVLPPEDASLQQRFLLLWCRMADFAVEYPDAMQFLESYREQLEPEFEDHLIAVPSALIELVGLLTRARIAKDQPALVLGAIVWGAFLHLFKLHRRGDCPFSEDLVRASGQCCLDAISRSRPVTPSPAAEDRMTILRI